jgi:hypothetical protein
MFEVNVLVNGKRIKQYRHDGKIYVEGRRGSSYELEFKNSTPHRVLAILSVDGLSVMDGKRADWNNSSGYVVDRYSAIVIPGWRLDDENVAQFIFGGRGNAYAASKGKQAKKNIGTIGCAVFKEKLTPVTFPTPTNPWPGITPSRSPAWTITSGSTSYVNWKDEPLATTFTVDDGTTVICDAAPTASPLRSSRSTKSSSKKEAGAPGTLNLGTEFGESTGHSVRTVSFTKEDSPAAVMEVIYSDRTGLKKMGVNLRGKAHRRYTEPKPFANTGCEPPAGWNG